MTAKLRELQPELRRRATQISNLVDKVGRMLDHRDPNCTGNWDLETREGGYCDTPTPNTAVIICKQCGTKMAYSKKRWLSACEHNLAGASGINAAVIGRGILHDNDKNRNLGN